jgi:streptogramin lyase
MKMKKLSIAVLVVMLFFYVATVSAETYTLDADFDEGTLVGVEHETVHDQLQLSKQAAALPFIWVPNNEGTISKVDTETGNELGRYHIAPFSACSPSRTTIDLKGNCWVGNRQAGTVVKVGLYEAGQYIDRNGDGIIQTSMDTNGDGNITGAEILPWGEDECVLYEVVLIPGLEGTFAPGQYPGPYDTNYWGTAPRGLAVDTNNNLWAGTYSTSKYYYINGEDGAILKTVDVSPWSHHAYGTVIDKNGILWSSGHTSNHVLRLDPSTDPPTINTVDIGHFAYGLGLDYLEHLFISGWDWARLSRVNIQTGVKEWTQYKGETYQARGVTCTSDNDLWVADSLYGTVLRYDNDGNFKVSISAGSAPTGVAVDAAGKVWVCNNGDEYIKRIDPDTNAIELSKAILGSGGHYSYSDMTGIVARSITTLIGNWTVVYDSGVTDTPWGTISWTSDEPAGTSVIVKVRSSNDQATWSPWESATNGNSLTATSNGRYLQIETTLQLLTGEVSPILYDLTVKTAAPTPCPCPGSLACYALDEGSGDIAGDSSGNGNDGTIYGATWTTGKKGGGLSFDGADDYVTIPIINSDEISVCAWFYKNAVDKEHYDGIFGGYYWDKDIQLREGFCLKFYPSDPHIVRFILVTQDAVGNKVQKTIRFDLGNSALSWYHVVGTYEQATGEQKLFVNGALVASRKHPTGNTVVPLTLHTEMLIGQSGPNGYFNGIIDDVCLSNRALSDQEVLDIYNGL